MLVVNQFDPKDSPPAFFLHLLLKFLDIDPFLLFFGEFVNGVGIALIERLVFHNGGHIAHSGFGLVWFDKSQFDFIILFPSLLQPSFPLQLFELLFGQRHG